MIIILATGILLIAISFIVRDKLPIRVAFIFMFIIMGFQAGVEGDYMAYMELFSIVHSGGAGDWRTIEDEPFFPFLVKIFPFNSTFLFTIFLVIFNLAVIVRLLERYCPKEYHYLAPVLFYFSFNMMLLQMKGLRQGLAIELMILAFLLADRKKGKWWSLVSVVIAYLTHNSMLVMIPFYLLWILVLRRPELIKKKKTVLKEKNLLPYILVGIYLMMYFFKITVLNQYLVPLILLTGSGGNRLAGYADTSNTAESLETNLFDISPLIVLYDAIIVFMVASYYKKADPKMRVFCIISIVAAFGDMLFFGAGVFARIIMFYVIFNLIVYPAIVSDIKSKYGKVWALAFMVLLIGYAMKTSFPWIMSTEGDRFGNYHFVFM